MIAQVGLKLKALRKKRGLTQQELSELSGVSERVIRRLETGKDGYRMSAETVCKLAKTLQVDFEFFFKAQTSETIVQKHRYYLHENELIAKTPRFSDTEKLIAFLQNDNKTNDIWQEGQIDDYIFLPAYLHVSFCFYMPDDSMAPIVLANDNLCIFKTTALNKSVPGLFVHHGQLYLRNWKKRDKTIHLFPINKQYPQMSFEEDSSDWNMIGICLYLWRDVRNEAGENRLLKELHNIFPFAKIE